MRVATALGAHVAVSIHPRRQAERKSRQRPRVHLLEGEAEITTSGKVLHAAAGEMVLMPANQLLR